MKQMIIVIGAGIIGASIAYQLAKGGADVTVLEVAGPAGLASGASFGWINASFFADDNHFALRTAGIAAHRRLATELGPVGAQFPGSLWWRHGGEDMGEQAASLRRLGYEVEEIGADRFAALEPHIATPPQHCLLLASEGAVDAAALTHGLLQAAAQYGARLICGVAATGLATTGGRVCGVETPLCTLPADRVVVAAGTGSTGFMARFGVKLPMLQRPGLLLRTQALPPVLRHILVAPDQELRQDTDGCILAPTVASHQGDDTQEITERPDLLADMALKRLARLLPKVNLEWETVTLAMRPVPQDGLPVIGACGPDGTYLATMHSGVTLAAIVGEMVAPRYWVTHDQGASKQRCWRRTARRGLIRISGLNDRHIARFRPKPPQCGSTGCIWPAGPSGTAIRF